MDKVGKIGGIYPVGAYHKSFGLCLLAAIIAFISVCFMKETLSKD